MKERATNHRSADHVTYGGIRRYNHCFWRNQKCDYYIDFPITYAIINVIYDTWRTWLWVDENVNLVIDKELENNWSNFEFNFPISHAHINVINSVCKRFLWMDKNWNFEQMQMLSHKQESDISFHYFKSWYSPMFRTGGSVALYIPKSMYYDTTTTTIIALIVNIYF